ncbi:hypothetical protein JL722_8019 [Aureococcus anophagefferens]|nr:hypothetical protein JL722_8019 [Aureococcus anophagefferens]
MLRAASADGRVADLAAALTSSGLSGVDFYCLLDYEADPALKDPATFEAAHAAAREAAKRALRRVALPASWSSRADSGAARAAALLGELEDAKRHYGLDDPPSSRSSPRSPRPARSRPCPARGATSVEHRDARCVAADDVCAFSLVRLLCGFRVTPARGAAAAALAALRGADASWDEDRDDGSVLCKGEGVDVSFPKRLGVNLALWAEASATRRAPSSRGRRSRRAGARLRSSASRSTRSSSSSAILRSGSAQHLVIWRVAKSAKRLRRLVELLGVKLLAAPGFAPRTKAQALRVLHATLAGFCDRSFGRRGGQEARRPAAAPSPRAATPFAALVDASLVRPLEHLALRAFGDAADLALPPNFAAKWDAVLAPLVSLVDTFAGAAEALADANATALAEHRSTTSTSDRVAA